MMVGHTPGGMFGGSVLRLNLGNQTDSVEAMPFFIATVAGRAIETRDCPSRAGLRLERNATHSVRSLFVIEMRIER